MFKLLSVFVIGITLLFSNFVWAGEVSRAQFTSEIQQREPVDMLITLSTDQTQIKYFTELGNLSGHKVTHQWVYNDKVMFERTFQVNGDRWRVWSSKTLQPGWTGRWVVNTLDEDGSQLLSQAFEYQ